MSDYTYTISVDLYETFFARLRVATLWQEEEMAWLAGNDCNWIKCRMSEMDTMHYVYILSDDLALKHRLMFDAPRGKLVRNARPIRDFLAKLKTVLVNRR